MKRLCFASIFNILCQATEESQCEMFNNCICKSIDVRDWGYEETYISKIKSGQRAFPKDPRQALSKKTFAVFKEDFTCLVLGKLFISQHKNVLLNLKDILFSDETIPNDIPLVHSYERSKKNTLLFSQDLSEVLSVLLYYSIISVDNKIYNDAHTDKITTLVSDDKLLELHPEWLERKKQDPNDHGIVDTYLNVREIDYIGLAKTSHNVDVVHIRGYSWTNDVREYLQERLLDPSTTIRIILLSPKSVFFEPYAHFIGTTREDMVAKFSAVFLQWKKDYDEIYKKVLRNKAKELDAPMQSAVPSMGKMLIFLGDFFPSKSLYRFDNLIIVNPSSMTHGRTGKLPTLLCRDFDDAEKENSFFATYSKEIETIMEESFICFDMAETTRQELQTYIDTL